VESAQFEQKLKASGYPEIRTNQLPPNCHNDEHAHPWDVHALVLEGDITLTVDGKKRKYGAGDEFVMVTGCKHIEDVGPQGVKYLVGRRDNKAIDAIRRTIQTYFDGLYEGDTQKLAEAFHENSHLYSLSENALNDLPREKWLDIVKGRPSPKSQNLKRTDRILSIDMSGSESALVKVECSIHPRYFTDYLTLLRFGERWRIVSKAFRTETKA
jgi:hypothetical protein